MQARQQNSPIRQKRREIKQYEVGMENLYKNRGQYFSPIFVYTVLAKCLNPGAL